MAKNLNLKNHPSVFFRTLDLFLETRNLAPSTLNNYHVLAGALMRFEHQSESRKPLELTSLTSDDISSFINFYRLEPPCGHRGIKRRSHNTLCAITKCLRTFLNWCVRQNLIQQNPFEQFDGIISERYATPYFLTSDERDTVASHNFNHQPELAIQRDIFIFQCYIGCRVSDLMQLRPDNISDGYLEYIAQKTVRGNPTVIRIPLHPRAFEIIKRYATRATDNRLLPFISPQRYNYAIKQILTHCGIKRSVSLLCPYSGMPIRRQINEIAASHIARRTFIGNLYRKVKDPNLIASLTGHVEGSRAFSRYRTIDDELKLEVIMLL